MGAGNEELNSDNFRYPGNYRGIVLDNNDPEKQGRIKVNVFGIFDNLEASALPWATPAIALTSGAGSGFGNVSIPEVGSYVFVFFEGLDVYQPVYFAQASDGVHGLPVEAETNYPYRKVTKTKNGIIIIVDDSEKEIYVNHPSGSYIKIDKNGNIVIKGTTVHINP